MKLLGKTALITGSAKGLGRRTALELAAHGCDVAINYVNSRDEAERLVEEIGALGRKAYAIQANIAIADDSERLVSETEKRLGGSTFSSTMPGRSFGSVVCSRTIRRTTSTI